jgi:hypothetical protein
MRRRSQTRRPSRSTRAPRYGRPELAAEVKAVRPDLRVYVQEELAQPLAEPYFEYSLDSATAGYGQLGAERAGLLRDRLDALVAR